MQRSDYLRDSHVQGFLPWLQHRFSEPGSFRHAWTSHKPRMRWECTSLWDAHRRYQWNGKSFEENEHELDEFSHALRAVPVNDPAALQGPVTNVMHWGGIRNTSARRMSEFLRKLPDSVVALEPSRADTTRLMDVPMSSGFTKVYHLLVDGLPIYDGRVGAALGYLARLYLQERSAVTIPETLQFGWMKARVRATDAGPNRDPSSAPLRFEPIRGDADHALCNVMAAWLLSELSEHAFFAGIPKQRRMRAIESSLFMIGYELPKGR